ncbi:MAG TPA: AgmX/PglI C-terminal domain-containing protein [Steroidobacteraceae bacterium]|nr:AgmX/PglI C-terminal domain-containing protein [Steroidobacteraceae bacterium]
MQAATQDAVTPQELEQLLAEARERLEALVREVRAKDAELESLAADRRQHQLLRDACAALEELDKSGGAKLFWGNREATSASEEHLRDVRKRIERFQARVDEIEVARRVLLDEISQQEEQTYLLEDDVFEALDEEEQLKHEWIVEREIDAIRASEAAKPWVRAVDDDRRFRKSVLATLLVSLLFALLAPLIPLPLSTLQQTAEVPDRIVTMMMETRKIAPPPVQLKPPPQKVVQQKPVEKPLPQKSVQPQEQKTEPATPEPEQGLLAFREKFENLKEAPMLARLGAQAHINDSNQSARPERSMLTTNAPGSSGGIKLASLSRDFGPNGGNERGAIHGAALTRATSNISSIGPADHPSSNGPGLARTDEEIQIVFDRYKQSLYRLYNRELRKDPTLQGQMVLRLTIEPNGSVSFCVLQSTDMQAPELVVQVVDRVKTFDFGAKEVPAITIVYPIDFLPAA